MNSPYLIVGWVFSCLLVFCSFLKIGLSIFDKEKELKKAITFLNGLALASLIMSVWGMLFHILFYGVN